MIRGFCKEHPFEAVVRCTELHDLVLALILVRLDDEVRVMQNNRLGEAPSGGGQLGCPSGGQLGRGEHGSRAQGGVDGPPRYKLKHHFPELEMGWSAQAWEEENTDKATGTVVKCANC